MCKGWFCCSDVENGRSPSVCPSTLPSCRLTRGPQSGGHIHFSPSTPRRKGPQHSAEVHAGPLRRSIREPRGSSPAPPPLTLPSPVDHSSGLTSSSVPSITDHPWSLGLPHLAAPMDHRADLTSAWDLFTAYYPWTLGLGPIPGPSTSHRPWITGPDVYLGPLPRILMSRNVAAEATANCAQRGTAISCAKNVSALKAARRRKWHRKWQVRQRRLMPRN